MKKRIISIYKCSPGEITADDIYSDKGVLIVPKDVTISDYIIKRLTDFRIFDIPVYEMTEMTEKATENIQFRIFAEKYKENIENIKEVVSDIVSGKKLDYKKVDNISNSIYTKVSSNVYIMECINKVRGIDEYTYTHSINVSLYSMLIAKWLGLGEEDIRDIIQAGLLHDIGKSKVPQSILNKRGALLPQEFEKIKEHVVIGYNLTADIPQLNDKIRQAILMHHERDDGNGYPMNAKGEDINLYAKIITVADVFDALTSERVYKRKITPFETFKEFEKIGFGHFDVKVMYTFLSNISSYYVGSKVKLDSGEIGEVVYVAPQCMSKPVIRVGETYVDLSRDTQRKIIEMV